MSSSNTIDNKTVDLQLRNENFEKNAKTSISTAERLSKALNFKGVSGKVFDGIKSGADLSKAGIAGLTGAVGSLNNSISAINVAGLTMVSKAASDAYEKIKQLVQGVTTDQIGEGWAKYETMTTSMQTIMSATEYAFDSQEQQLEAVTKQMEKLNWFADETAFNLNDMTSSIGKFTANKVDLDTAVTAIQGIGTWASKSGASVQDASRAMYNLSQAISVGSVKLIDWKSIENANMSTAQFKETAIQTAEALGTLTKVEDGLWKTNEGNEVSVTNFNEALKDEWFTSDVLLQSLNEYGKFAVKLNDYSSEFNSDFGARNIMDLIDAYKEGTMTTKDWKQASEDSGVELQRLKEIIKDLGQEEYAFSMSAFRAAQETKTWSEAVDYTKEAVSSGWMRTFQTLFGDYTDAKKLWSDMSDFMYEVFVTGGEKRNELLEEAFSSTDAITTKQWKSLEKQGKIDAVYVNAIRKVADEHGIATNDMLSDYEAIFKAVQEGQITSGMLTEARELMMRTPADNEAAERVKAIAEEDEAVKAFLNTLDGYTEEDLEKITFGDHKYTEGYEELEAGLDGVIKALGLTQEESDEAIDALKAMGYFGGVAAEGWSGYTDEELKALGMNDEQIKKFKELREAGEDWDAALKQAGVDTTTAGQHWTQGLHNLMDIVLNFKEVAETTFSEFFPPLEATSVASWLKSFDEGTAKVAEWVKTSDTLKNGLRAVASVVDVFVSNIRMIGEALAMKGIIMAGGKILGMVGPFIKMTAAIAKGAVVFSFLKGLVSGFVGDGAGGLANTVANLTQKFMAWFKAVDPINKALDWLSNKGKSIGQSIRGWFDSFAKIPTVNKGFSQLRRGFTMFTQGFSEHMKDGKTRLDEFNKKVEEMGGIRPDNFAEIFKMGKDELIDWLKTFPGVKTMMRGLTNLWAGLKTKLEDMGIPVTKIENGIKKIFDTVKTGVTWAFKGFNWVLDMADKLSAAFMDLPFVGSAIENFGKAFDTIATTVGPFLEGLPDRFAAFGERASGILGDGFQLADVPAIFTAFKEEVLDYIGNWDGFKAIGDAFSNLWKDITTPIGENEEVQKVFGPIKDFFDQLKESLSVIELPETFDDIPEFLNTIKEAMNNIPKADGNGWGDMLFNGIKWVLERIVDLAIFVTSHWKLALGIVALVYLFKKVSGIFHDIHEYFKAMTKELKARAFLETAAGVVLLAAAIWIIVNTFKDMIELFGQGDSFVDNMKHIAPGLIAIVVILGMVSMLFKTVGKMNVQTGTAWGVAASVAAVWILAHAFIDFAKELDTGGGFGANMAKIIPALIAMGAIILLMKTLFKTVGEMKVQPGTAFGIAAAIASLWVVAQAFKSLSKLDIGQIGKGILALGAVIGSMIALMVVASATKIDAKPLIAIASVIAIVAVALGALAYIGNVNPDGLKLAIGALVGVVLSLTLLMGVVGALKPKVSAMAVLILIIGGVAAVIGLLNHFVGVDNTTKIADSLAKLFGSLALLMVAVGIVGKLGLGSILTGVIGLAAVIVGITAALTLVGYLVDKFGVEGYLDKGIETVRKVLDVVCEAITGIIQAIGQGLFGDRTPLQMLADDVAYMVETVASDTFKENIRKIGELNLLSSSGVNLALVGVLGAIFGAEGAIMSIFNLISETVTGKTAIESLVDDISYLVETIGSEEFKNNLTKVAELDFGGAFDNLLEVSGITAIFGAEGAIMSIFNLISETTTDKTAIESVVDDISYLVETIGSEEFIANIARIGVLNMSGAFTNLTGIAGITAIFGAEGALSTIADAIIGFATGDKDYSSMSAAMSNVTTLAETLGDQDFLNNMAKIGAVEFPTEKINSLAGSVAIFEGTGALTTIVDSIIGFAIGEDKFSAMDETLGNIKKLAETLGGEEFTTNMAAFSSITVPTEDINNLATLIGDLSFDGLVSAVQGALTSWLTGDEETALENWADDVETLAGALGTWNTKMAEAGDLVVDEEAITSLTNAVGAITRTGGLAGMIEEFVKGEVDTAEFEKRVGSLGTAMGNFNTNLGEVDGQRLTLASRALTSMTTIASKFNDFSLLLDNADNANIAFQHITDSINMMVTNITDPEAAVQVGQASASISTAMSTFAQIKIDGDIVNDDLVAKFEANVKSIIAAIEGTADVDVSGVDRVKGAMEDLSSADIGDAKGQGKSLSKLAEEDAKSFSKAGADAGEGYAESLKASTGTATAAASGMMSAVSGALSDTTAFYQAGLNMVGAIAGGIYTATSIAVAAAQSLGSQVAAAIDTSGANYEGFNFVAGFAEGIRNYTYISEAAARSMAAAALAAAKAEINSHSPAKETIKLGGFFGEGFGIGITQTVGDVSEAASDLGYSAIQGLKGAVRTINDIISSDIDSDPVVRPVLDLSEIQNGAGNITSMLSAVNIGDPFGSFGVISNSVEARRSATSLDDVVSALGSVEQSTSNIRGGDTYNVNGVTYDDGSNIADAIRILTHAVVTERRR